MTSQRVSNGAIARGASSGDDGDDPVILSVLGAVHTFVRNFGTARVLLERAIAL